MARITSPKLKISLDLPANIAKVEITGKVVFTTYEVNTMNLGIVYRLDCKLMEYDDLADGMSVDVSERAPSDLIHTFSSQYFKGPNALASKDFVFQTTLSSLLLNKDKGPDEVYGVLELHNLETGTVSAYSSTPLITHEFM